MVTGSLAVSSIRINVINDCPNTVELFDNHVWIGETIASRGAPSIIESNPDLFLPLSATANNGTLVGLNLNVSYIFDDFAEDCFFRCF